MKALNYQLERQFVWTAIPAGRVRNGQEALVSVLLTPRLLGQGTPLTVSSFGMELWPKRLEKIKFKAEVQVQESGPVSTIDETQIQRVPYLSAERKQISFSLRDQLSAWKALFDINTLVHPYDQKSYVDRCVRTFPTLGVVKEVRQAYGDAASTHLKHGCDDPTLNPELLASLKSLRESWEAGLQRTDDGTCEQLGADAPPLARAYDFYRRENHKDYTMPSMNTNTATTKPEFHDIIAKLADHPLLLRALGLVIDLALPYTKLKNDKILRIIPIWPNPDTDPTPGWTNCNQRDICPKTGYEIDESRFHPKSTARIHRGMLALKDAGLAPSANPNWEIISIDVDGAALRMVGSVTKNSEDQALPALRSSTGLGLVQRDREIMHKERVKRSKRLASIQELEKVVLDAEDLLGGYRLDVLDTETVNWRSLCQRRVHYKIGQIPQLNEPCGLLEEGYVRSLSATTGAGAADSLYIHETVLCWDGWSHAVQRPDRKVEMGVMPQLTALNPPFEYNIEAERGSLPRLQFGRIYQLRVRVADLAGGGLYLNEVDHEEERTAVIPHRRFEPILPPEVVPTRKYQDGEGPDRLIIRSDRDISVEDYARKHGYRPDDLRHILAPRSSLEMAMQHRNTFDSAMGPEVPVEKIEKLFEVAKRADRNLRDIPGSRPIEEGTDSNGAYIVVPEELDDLPWLTDWIAKAFILNNLSHPLDQSKHEAQTTCDQITCQQIKINWIGEWYNRKPVAFRLVSAKMGCKVIKCEELRRITVALGPAEELRLELSSCPTTDNIDLLGIPKWIDGITSDQIEQIAEGKHRMITPKKIIKLVHAVQRPLQDPSGGLIAKRNIGETICVLGSSELSICTKSTGRIDIHASWEDCDDNITQAEPCNTKHNVQVGSYDISYGPLKLPEIRQEFGDTRRRRVTYTVTAISRFQDYFGQVTATNPDACHVQSQLVTDIPSSARPHAPKVLYTVPTFHWEQSIDGMTLTRLRHGGGLRVFLERPWCSTGVDEALGVLAWRADSPPPKDLSYVSVAGADPIWLTDAPKFILTSGDINAPVSTQEYLPEGEANMRQPVQVYPVQFDKEDKRWYADINLSKVANSSYFPFVRLAVCRYQEICAPGINKISAPILTEPIQLPPHRRLVVTKTPGGATIKLEGLGPNGPKMNVIHAEVQILEAGYTAVIPDEARSGIAEAEIDLENMIAGWTTIYSTSGALGQSLSLDVPISLQRPMRLLVQEFEVHPPQLSDTGSPIESNGKLVYADTVPLQDSEGLYSD
ncbi:hypothetical protein BG07_5694 (plasmid) [Bacillus pseudomycoides]|uniref:hypothetical protein n=1 Tax=Bacillus pseudomycoides TaxID=64104 RepID=UPI0004ED78C3|nr:hypothetical protein [Bacillus pseudomycoides]AIK35359.1 hypothetical protein DJ92_5773 [Bacillus pseudomycoides]AJI14523.1 hypothetical protein BG07_5694 [Bacillus pseudomycoides]